MKSKLIAYLLWFFLGVFGVHRFYLGKVGSGILYLFTLGVFGIGWFIDLFTLGGQVDTKNALILGKINSSNNKNSNTNNIVVNIPAMNTNPIPFKSNQELGVAEQLQKLVELKEKLLITEEEYEFQKAKILAR